MGEYFEVRKGLTQGCVLSPLPFSIFFDIVVIRVDKMAIGWRVKLRDENGGCWEIKQVLYAYDKRAYPEYCECI